MAIFSFGDCLVGVAMRDITKALVTFQSENYCIWTCWESKEGKEKESKGGKEDEAITKFLEENRNSNIFREFYFRLFICFLVEADVIPEATNDTDAEQTGDDVNHDVVILF